MRFEWNLLGDNSPCRAAFCMLTVLAGCQNRDLHIMLSLGNLESTALNHFVKLTLHGVSWGYITVRDNTRHL